MKALILALLLGFPQHSPVKTAVQVRVLKVERIKRNEDSNLWYTVKLAVRDREKLYGLEAECISTNSDSHMSCGNLSVPHAGTTVTVTFYDAVLVQFGDDKLYYEVASEEVSDCK